MYEKNKIIKIEYIENIIKIIFSPLDNPILQLSISKPITTHKLGEKYKEGNIITKSDIDDFVRE
jgi:hypothetical protein